MQRAVAVAVAAAMLIACGREPASPPPAPAAASHVLRVGLLTPGSINDGGWNAIAWEGLQRIERELGAEVSHQETKTPAEFEEGFRSYGARGFDLAFGHGLRCSSVSPAHIWRWSCRTASRST